MFRQGDVLIRPVTSIPDGLKRVPLDNGRMILAYGEVTGHAHAVIGDVEFLAADLEDLEQRFLRVEREQANLVDSWECRNERGEMCWVPAYQSRDQVEAAGFTIVDRVDVAGVVVEHEEHLHFVVTPGDHEVIRQREYQPEAPVWVAD